MAVAEPTDAKPGRVPAHLRLREDQPLAWIRTATSDRDGRFTLPSVPNGRLRIVIQVDGYHHTQWIVARGDERTLRPFFIEALADNPYRTVVAQQSTLEPSLTSHDLNREEIATLPGTQGDSVRALQNLPGVARPAGGAGLLVLRGAAPNQSQVFYGEHPIPRAFHTLGFTSVVQADLLDAIEMQPSNFSAKWGNASGGVVLLQPKLPRRDGVHGFAKVDITSAGAMLEAPVGRGSLLVAGQRGYIDGVLRLVERVDPTAVFALPRYFDYQAQYNRPLGTAGAFTARAIGVGDRWEARTLEPGGKRSQVSEFRDQFHRFEVVFERRRGAWRGVLTPAFRFGRGLSDVGQSQATSDRYVTSWRAEASRDFSKRFALTVGTDALVTATRQRLTQVQGFLDDGRPISVRVATKSDDIAVSLYTWATLRLGQFTLWPGARVTGFARRIRPTVGATNTTFMAVVDPRLLGQWTPHPKWTVRAGVGAYSQANPTAAGGGGIIGDQLSANGGRLIVPGTVAAALDPGLGGGGTLVGLRRLQALQSSVGLGYAPLRSLTIDGAGYVRAVELDHWTRLRTYGVELLARYRMANRLYGWVGYTFMHSTVTTTATRTRGPLRFPSTYEQRHNLVMLASYALPKDFRIGGRMRVVTGGPYTPFAGSYTSDFGVLPLGGAPNSRRFPTFHQLDIRVDKRWVKNRAVVTSYIDVQNVYNHNNVEAYIYSEDYRDQIGAIGLPIFPSLGLRVDW